MNLREHLQPPQSIKGSPTSQTKEAWFVIFLFSFVTIMLLAVGSVGSKVLGIVFPLGAFVVGWFLYFRYPAIYIGFIWWLFFLVSFVRRFADFRAGAFTDSSPILLAPFMAILVCAHTLYFNLPKAREQGTAPFLLALASTGYGYCVGILNGALPIKATVTILGWITPILFGYHLYVNWRRYPEYKTVIQKVFLWGALVMGIYGVYQYMVAPQWDRLWLIGSGLTSSAGRPEPFGIRVWSTLNSPGPFGDVMATTLLILFSSASPLILPAAIAGGLAFLLSSVRVAWIGWLVGMLFISTSLRPKQQLRLITLFLVLALFIIPLSTMEPFSTTISKRLETLSDIQNDTSAQDRQGVYKRFFQSGMYNYIGDGIGLNEIVDSGPLSLVLDLGWVGTIPYLGSILLLTTTLMGNLKKQADLFIKLTGAVLIKSTVFFLATRVTSGIHGMFIWSFLGIGLAGQSYFKYQRALQMENIIENSIEKTLDVEVS